MLEITGEQRDAAGLADFGLNHISLYCDDIEGSLKRLVDAGGEVLSEDTAKVVTRIQKATAASTSRRLGDADRAAADPDRPVLPRRLRGRGMDAAAARPTPAAS
ncbi:hypothetical protein [Dermacoccus nishinomiyaensis]|uniref:hypothetical protein n=1 Tax=Dermacoccus nishinomiyaensis TaxID=1274 RepID=UPI001F508B9A|nr:hypothetical protein [Dermacoccus nishinomiyaensis]MCI0154578.1 hypothetical protein [Dermacoccus nishinomiyaensis]